jgi:hypothetical protein
VASASKDAWADPESEFMALVHAQPVYKLFGLPGLNKGHIPPPGQPLHEGVLGYHQREGVHNLTEEDWKYFMDFADKHLKAPKADVH